MPYNTVSEADTYFSARYGFAKWEPLSEPEKTAVLISANQILDNLYNWFGSKLDPDQVNEFPRDYQTIVPANVQYAELEIAYQIIETGSLSTKAEDALEELKAGSVSLKFKVDSRPENPLLTGMVKALLSSYGDLKNAMGNNGSRMIPIERG